MLRLLPPYAAVRYKDRYTERWIRFRSPENWRGRIGVRYRRIPFARVQPSGSLTHVEVKAHWREMLAQGGAIPPLVVCGTPDGNYYLFDGNHRYCALADYFGEYGASLAKVRAAIIEPLRGYQFTWRWFDGYGTYLLDSKEEIAPPRSRGFATPVMLNGSQACSRVSLPGQFRAVLAGVEAEERDSELLVSAAAAD